MYKVAILFALTLAATVAMPQFQGGNRLVTPGGFQQPRLVQPDFSPAFAGTGYGAVTGKAGFEGVSASGVRGISSAQNGGIGTGTGTGSASLNLFTGQAGATGQGSGSSFGK